MKQTSLLKNIGKLFAVYGLGYFLNKGIAFFMLPLYTHYLPPRDYGVLEMLELTTYVVSLILGMGLTEAMVRFYHEHGDDRSRNLVISSVFITTVASSSLALAVLIPFSGFISGFVFKSTVYYRQFIMIFLAMAMNMGIEICTTYIRIREMPVRFISYSTAQLLLNLGFNILCIVFLGMGMNGVLVGGLISSLLIGIFLYAHLIREVGLGFSWKILTPMLKYGVPLIGTWLGMYVINFSDRFILQRLLPADVALSQVGIYSLAYKFGMLPSVLILSPFLMLWAPKQFQIVHETDAPEIFSRVFNYFWFVQLFFGLGLCVLIHDILRLMVKADYFDAARYVPLLALSYICFGAYNYMQFGILYRKRTRILALTTLSMAALNVILNLVLVPEFGVMGSAFATFFAIFLMVLVALLMSQKLYPIPYEFGRLAKMTLLAGILYASITRLNIGNIAVSIIIKSTIVLAYPAILLMFRVSKWKEILNLRALVGMYYKRPW